jgi:hypothetical protein
MQVFTPADVARNAANKYLAVLVAAQYARALNEFPRLGSTGKEKKLTTRALERAVPHRAAPPRRARAGRRVAAPAGAASGARLPRPAHPARRHRGDRLLQVAVRRA